jgi:hypothetical protein
MRIERINYQKVFRLQEFVNERIGVEVVINEGDSVEEALRIARELVEEDHKRANPHLYTNLPTIDAPHPQEPVIQLKDEEPVVDDPELKDMTKEEKRICMLIKGATTLQEVAKYKAHVPKHLTPRYLKRVKELSKA